MSEKVWACPASKAGGSGFPLLLLGRITGLWGIRCNPSRGFPFNKLLRYIAYQPSSRNMATAISGAIIIEESGGRMRYRQKCDKCGHSPPTVVIIGAPPGANKLTTTFKCPKCGNQQRVEIAGR